jgi:hypothetical protein
MVYGWVWSVEIFQLGSTIVFFDDLYTVEKLRVRRRNVNGCLGGSPRWF